MARQEFSCARAIAEVEYNGIHLNLSRWNHLRKKTEVEQQTYLEKLYEYTGHPKVQIGFFDDKVLNGINLDSNKQILNILNDNGIPVDNTSKHILAAYSHNPLEPIDARYLTLQYGYRKAKNRYSIYGPSPQRE